MAKLSNLLNNYVDLVEDLSLMPLVNEELTTNIFEDNGDLVIEMDLSGLDADDIDISIEGNRLFVSGSQKNVSNESQENFQMREVRYGSFDRVISLPNDINQSEAQADFEDGILTIEIPKSSASSQKSKKLASKKPAASKSSASKSAASKKSTASKKATAKKATASKSAASNSKSNNSSKKAANNSKKVAKKAAK